MKWCQKILCRLLVEQRQQSYPNVNPTTYNDKPPAGHAHLCNNGTSTGGETYWSLIGYNDFSIKRVHDWYRKYILKLVAEEIIDLKK